MRLRSRRYGWYVLGVLASLNFFNYANRNVVLPIYDELRGVFSFSNAELGLLTTVFMAFHALIALPAGWAADRFDRRRVIALGVLVWTVGALACAAAADGATLLLGRALAGFGSGALVPVANALLCDVFPSEEKARTVSFFNVGLFLGGVAGFVVGAACGFPAALLVVSIPCCALAIMVATLDVAPRRATVMLSQERLTWAAFVRDALSILRVRTLRWMLCGATLVCFAAGGLLAWFVDFIATSKGLTAAGAAGFLGAAALTAGLSGVVAGGVVGDRLVRRFPQGRLASISIGLFCAAPFALVALHADEGPIFYVSAWGLLFFIPWYHGPLAAVVDDLVPDERAATAQAGIICLMHLFGTAPSAYIVGKLADAVGLHLALLAPVVAVILAGLAFMVGWPSVARDRAAARGGVATGGGSAL